MLNYDGSVRFGRIGTGWGAPYVVTSSFLPSMNDWHYLVGTSEYDGTNTILRIYIDGQLAGTTGPAGVAGTLSYAAASAAIRIGARSDLIGDSFFHGLIDEVRYSATTRSADWIKAQYLSMNDQFLTFGTEGAVPEPASVLLLLGGLGLLARRRAASRKGG
jgi:hypothetical protein